MKKRIDATQAAHEARERVTDETVAELGETGCRKGEPWWQVYYLFALLGGVVVTALVTAAQRSHTDAGMMIADGSRKRTLGGVFFALAKDHAERKTWRRVRTFAAYTWARRWLRKLGKGTLPTTPEELRVALAARGDVASPRGERVFFELVAKQKTEKAGPVAEVGKPKPSAASKTTWRGVEVPATPVPRRKPWDMRAQAMPTVEVLTRPRRAT